MYILIEFQSLNFEATWTITVRVVKYTVTLQMHYKMSTKHISSKLELRFVLQYAGNKAETAGHLRSALLQISPE